MADVTVTIKVAPEELLIIQDALRLYKKSLIGLSEEFPTIHFTDALNEAIARIDGDSSGAIRRSAKILKEISY